MNHRQREKQTIGKNQGFTMIEVLIGILLLTIGLLAVAQMQVMTMTTNALANQRTVAITLAQDQLEILRARPYSNIGDSPLYNTSGIYSRSWTVENDTPAANMKTVTMTVSWLGKQVQLQTIIASGNL